MAEELAFEDVNISSSVSDGESGVGHVMSKSVASVDGSSAVLSAPRSIRPPGSPGGSLGSGSAVSRGSEAARSAKSMRSHKSMERLASC